MQSTRHTWATYFYPFYDIYRKITILASSKRKIQILFEVCVASSELHMLLLLRVYNICSFNQCKEVYNSLCIVS